MKYSGSRYPRLVEVKVGILLGENFLVSTYVSNRTYNYEEAEEGILLISFAGDARSCGKWESSKKFRRFDGTFRRNNHLDIQSRGSQTRRL